MKVDVCPHAAHAVESLIPTPVSLFIAMVVRATRVTTDRVQKIQLGQYDQVFALTQKLINDGLSTKFDSLPENSPLRQSIQTPAHINGGLKGRVLAPEVVVKASFDSNLSGLNYMIRFDDGICQLHWLSEKQETAEDPDDFSSIALSGTMESGKYKMKDWALAFHVMLGMTEVERGSDKFKETVGDVLPGKYSLNELVAKFDTAEYDESGCYFGTTDWSKMPQGARNSFKVLINDVKSTILKLFKETGTIGFALENKEASQAESSPKLNFEPCGIQYQTYPWIDNTVASYQPTHGTKGNAKLNYLLYAEVTKDDKGQKRALPSWEERYLDKHMGNWTDGRLERSAQNESSGYGAFHMSSKNFFDRYLLKKLKVLNSTLDPTLESVNVRIDGKMSPVVYWSLDLRYGDLRTRNADDEYYDFKAVNDERKEWKYTSSSGKKRQDASVSLLGGNTQCWIEAEVSCTNTVNFEAGSDVINVAGSSRFKCKLYSRDKVSLEDEFKIELEKDYEVNWSMVLDLEAVSDGGIQIKTTITGPTAYAHKDDEFNSPLGFVMCLPWYVQAAMKRAMHNAKNISGALAQDLENTQALCLPAKGVFCFKDPILSGVGDLVCSVDYVAGVPPKDMLNSNIEVVVNKDAVHNKRVVSERNEPLEPWKGITDIKTTLSTYNGAIRAQRELDPNWDPVYHSGPAPINMSGDLWLENNPDWSIYSV